MTGPARRDRLERVTDLVLVLLHTEQPLTLDSIANQVPGYPQEHAARRQAFERDKRLLRDEGIPVLTQHLEGDEQYGYLIEREAFYLPDLALEPDEQVALHLAVAGVHLGDPSGRDALLKLGAAGLGEVRPIATLVPPQALIDLFEAVRTRSITAFSYRGGPREVVSVGLWFRFGHWYLVAWDLARTAVRTFRVDRIDGTAEVRPGSHEVPDDIDVRGALPDDPWRSEGDDLVTTRIRVDAIEGPRVAEEVGNDKVESRDDDGSVVLRLRVTGFAAIRLWVLGLLQHAEILEPAEFRAEMESWLTAQIDGTGSDSTADAVPSPTSGSNPKSKRRSKSGRGTSPGRSAPPDSHPADLPGGDPVARANPGKETGDRLRRLLALVGWLAQVGEAPITEVASRFGLGEEELIRELELAACCGVPPYTPDALMEIEVTESTVRAFLPADFARPRRLTPAEGFAVAASARLILAVPGSDDDALRRALAKLDAVMGSREVMGVDVDAPPFLGQVRHAAESGHAIEIDYHSASRDEVTTRVVEPAQAITMDGHWYLDAFCHRAGDMRRFRIDRISAVRLVGEGGLPPRRPERGVADTFVPGPGAVEVQLRLGPGAQWVAESVPVQVLARGDDGLVTDVVLSVAGMAWFERLLLQLGDEAYVVRPEELQDLGARAARRVLSVYQKGDGDEA